MKAGVFVLKIHPGMHQSQLEQICKSVDFEVLIIETYGSGTVFNDDYFVRFLNELLAKGVKIVNISQCVYGNVMEIYRISEVFFKLGIINGKAITLESAITKSMHLLGRKITDDEFAETFVANLAGELS